MNWQLDHISNLCTDDQKEKFTCNDTYTFFTNTLLSGMAGPARLLGPGSLYRNSLYGFLVGAIIPIPFYILSRWRFPKLQHVYTPLLFAGGIAWSPINLSLLIHALTLAIYSKSSWGRSTLTGGQIITYSSIIWLSDDSIWPRVRWQVVWPLPW